MVCQDYAGALKYQYYQFQKVDSKGTSSLVGTSVETPFSFPVRSGLTQSLFSPFGTSSGHYVACSSKWTLKRHLNPLVAFQSKFDSKTTFSISRRFPVYRLTQKRHHHVVFRSKVDSEVTSSCRLLVQLTPQADLG